MAQVKEDRVSKHPGKALSQTEYSVNTCRLDTSGIYIIIMSFISTKHVIRKARLSLTL